MENAIYMLAGYLMGITFYHFFLKHIAEAEKQIQELHFAHEQLKLHAHISVALDGACALLPLEDRGTQAFLSGAVSALENGGLPEYRQYILAVTSRAVITRQGILSRL